MGIPLIKDKDGYIVKVHVKTGSKQSGIENIEGEQIKIRVTSQPHKGMANRELLEILSEFLSIPKSRLEILKGISSKQKIIKIRGDIN